MLAIWEIILCDGCRWSMGLAADVVLVIGEALRSNLDTDQVCTKDET